MSVNIKLIDFQLAQAELARELNKLRGGKFVTVGIHEDAGNVEDGSMTQAQNGALQNFGNDKIPPRPWLVPGAQSATQDIIDVVADGLEQQTPPDQTLEQVGAVAVGAVQQYITDLRTPPNAPYTIEKKGSDNPLIDTGSMRAAVTYKVTSERPGEGL